MTFLTPLALLGLILLPILVVLHLRRRRFQLEDVPSTLLWRDLVEETQHRSSRLRVQSLPLLLLQLLAVALLVGGLARPASLAMPIKQTALHIYVVDASARMAATDLAPNRLTAAKAVVNREIDRAPAGTRFTVVVASAQSYLLVSSTDRTQVHHSLASVVLTPAQPDFVTAVQMAAGILAEYGRQQARMTVLHAAENPVPPIRGARGILRLVALGHSDDNQSILHFSVRCPVDVTHPCAAFAAIRNENYQAVPDGVIIRGDGDVLGRQSLLLHARADTELSFSVPRGLHILQMQLTRPDILPLDNVAWSLVDPGQRLQVTVVGSLSGTARVRQALASLPNVVARYLAPRQYTLDQAQRSDLLILDGWRPPGSLPETPALLFINPPSLPMGSVNGSLTDTTISGVDSSSSLLSGVDLTSLDVPPDTAAAVTPPPWVTPVVWAADGPLLAAGTDGTRRVAVLAFDPAATNLTQLGAFPLLLWNIAQWSQAWLPMSAGTGEDVLIADPPATSVQVVRVMPGGRDVSQETIAGAQGRPVTFEPLQPGVYRVVERGPWGSRSRQIAANADTEVKPAGGAVQLGLVETRGGAGLVVTREVSSWWPWIGLVALLAIVAEWLYLAWREG